MLEAKGKDAAANGDQATAQQYAQDAAMWSEGGEYRIAVHAAVGALGGGFQGAAGAAASAAASPEIAKALEGLGLPEPVRQVVVAAAGTASGAVAGGVAGASAALNQTVNNYLKHEEIDLKKQELSACKDNACRQAVNDKWLKVSQKRDEAMTVSCLDGSSEQCHANLRELSRDINELLADKNGTGVKPMTQFESNNLKQAVAEYYTNLEVLARRGESLMGSTGLSPADLFKNGYLTSAEVEGLEQLRAGQWQQFFGAVPLLASGKPVSSSLERVPNKPTLQTRPADQIRDAPDILVTPKGIAVSNESLKIQGTSPLSGDFRGLSGASVEEILARVPSGWKMVPQDRGQGVKFLDEQGIERLRMHAPSPFAPAGSNSASGWTLRVMDPAGNYYDASGIVVSPKANSGHIPIRGNPKVAP